MTGHHLTLSRSILLSILLFFPLCDKADRSEESSRGAVRMTGAQRGEIIFYTRGCTNCHRVGDYGGTKGPDLTEPWNRIDQEYAMRWIRNPQSVKPETEMIYPNLKDEEIRDVVEFLFSEKRRGVE